MDYPVPGPSWERDDGVGDPGRSDGDGDEGVASPEQVGGQEEEGGQQTKKAPRMLSDRRRQQNRAAQRNYRARKDREAKQNEIDLGERNREVTQLRDMMEDLENENHVLRQHVPPNILASLPPRPDVTAFLAASSSTPPSASTSGRNSGPDNGGSTSDYKGRGSLVDDSTARYGTGAAMSALVAASQAAGGLSYPAHSMPNSATGGDFSAFVHGAGAPGPSPQPPQMFLTSASPPAPSHPLPSHHHPIPQHRHSLPGGVRRGSGELSAVPASAGGHPPYPTDPMANAEAFLLREYGGFGSMGIPPQQVQQQRGQGQGQEQGQMGRGMYQGPPTGWPSSQGQRQGPGRGSGMYQGAPEGGMYRGRGGDDVMDDR